MYGGRQLGQEWLSLLSVSVLTVVLIVVLTVLLLCDRFEHSKCMVDGKRVGENIACSWSSAGADYTGKDPAIHLLARFERKPQCFVSAHLPLPDNTISAQADK